MLALARPSATLKIETAPAINADFHTYKSGAITAEPVTTQRELVRKSATILPAISFALFIVLLEHYAE